MQKSQNKVVLTKGASKRVYVTPYYSFRCKGLSALRDEAVTRSTSNPKVAKVSRTGKITAVKTGAAVVFAKTINATARFPVTVVKATQAKPIAQLSFSVAHGFSDTAQSGTGEVVRVRKGTPGTARAVFSLKKPANAAVRWKSSNPEGASITPAGFITFQKKGAVTITCKAAAKRPKSSSK